MKKKKITYKVQNWSTYNQSLINRGNITLWFDDNALKNWFANSTGKRGRPCFYSDQCIELAWIISSLYRLPLRATQGFLEGLLLLLNIDLPVPHYSQICRRAKKLKINYKVFKQKGKLDIVVDSTGLKIYGEGEWKMRIHGKDKRRTWRKLHLAVNPDNFQIEAMELTKSNKTDGKVFPQLISPFLALGKIYADAAYMYQECFDAIAKKEGQAIIDLRSGTSLAKNPTEGLKQRNKIVEKIWAYGGKKRWKEKSGYHRRSLAETQMYRFKQILGGKLSSRSFDNQVAESNIKALILNKMTMLGMPQTIAV